MKRIERRAFLGWLSGGFVAAVLGGCGGGGSKEQKRTVRGIVLEDAGDGKLQPAKAGQEIFAYYPVGPTRTEGGRTRTDNEGRFTINLAVGNQYEFRSYLYPFTSDNGFSICATVPLVGIPGTGPLTTGYEYSGSGSVLPDIWRTRSAQAALDYGTDIAILANLPCVGSYKPT